MSSAKGNIKDRLIGLFSSLRLAVGLLILLALASVVGTFIPQELDSSSYVQRFGPDAYRWLKALGVIDLYHSWGFRALMALLTANLVVCTARRLKPLFRRSFEPNVEKGAEAIKALRIFNELPYPDKADVLVEAFHSRRFSVVLRGRHGYCRKGTLGLWGDMVTHVSIVLIILGAVVGSLGFIGTVNIYEGGKTDQFFNWSTGKDQPLGFTVYVDNFTLEHYPVDMKLVVRRNDTNARVDVIDTKEGSAFQIKGTAFTVRTLEFDVDNQEAVLEVDEMDNPAGVYRTSHPDGGPQAPPLFPFSFELIGFKDPVAKSVSSSVRIVKGGKVEASAVVEVNRPLTYGGLKIYQTGYNKDQDGKVYTGLQIVRDPGIPIVWSGFVLILVGLFLSFFYCHRQVWIYVDDDRLVVGGSTNKDWSGFMREYGGALKSFVQEVEP